MKLNGKQRKLSNAVKWRVDCDYLDKLPPAEREYMGQFLSEYYLGNTAMFSKAIHSEKQRRKLRTERAQAEKDIVTAGPREVGNALRESHDGNLRKRGNYSPADYQAAERRDPEDTILDALEP